MYLLQEKLDNFPLFKVSLIVILVALSTLIGIKIGEAAGKLIYYILH